ncbi:TolC family protein [Massilibacteroides sp.]|uniref:TolC family protein n=1 Tax=Massilibacteroides sp. TaxID=2034766 RepID=UPI002625B545|nr:TolC family protein [Massilibacteroides sp.]MDD4514289.1 TolC family protein [Massilibacteroides sp.]
MKKKIYIVMVLVGLRSLSFAQEKVWTLDECMKYAVENSTKVKKALHTNDTYKAEQLSAFGSFLPSLTANVGAQLNYGRSIDPETNTYSNTSTFNNGYSISSSLPIFYGGRLINQWKLSKVNRLLGKQTVRQTEDELAINTMQAYIDVVFYQGTAKLAAEKLEESSRLLYKTKRQEELGLKGKADVAQIEAQVASDDYDLTHQENMYNTALLTLKEYMNYDAGLSLELDTTLTTQEYTFQPESTDAIFAYASENNPLAQQAALTLKNNKLQHLIAKGRLFPTISLSAGVSTNYFENLSSGAADPAAFKSQFKNNRGEYISLNISIPLFDGFENRTTIRRARNNMRIAAEQQTETLRQLQITIEKAVADRDGYLKEMIQMEKQVNANQLAYQLTLRKFEEGLMSSLDLQTSANQLIQSKVNLLQRRLLYIVKVRQVDYYKGGELVQK